MSIKDWKLGQRVTVHFPHANQGAPKFLNTVITKLGRKYISVNGLQTEFDATLKVPRSSHDELYTFDGYAEMLYSRQVMRLVNSLGTGQLPMRLMLQLGDYLNIERPDHLRTKENTNVEKQPIPSTTCIVHTHRPRHTRAR